MGALDELEPKQDGGAETNQSPSAQFSIPKSARNQYKTLDEMSEKELLEMIATATNRTSKNVAFYFWCGMIGLGLWLFSLLVLMN